MVKVLAVVGSPRKGNTYNLVKMIIDTIVQKRDVDAELVHLADFEIRHCSGCSDFCEETGQCCIEDDMQSLYPKMKEAAVIIIGTPTYYWNVTGLLKSFIDRTNPLYNTKSLKGKMGAAVSVSEENGQELALSAISSFFELQGVKQVGGIALARGDKPIGRAGLDVAKALGETIASRLA